MSPLSGSLPKRPTAAHAKFMVSGFFKKWSGRSLSLFALIVFTSLPVFALPTNKSIWGFDRRVWYAQNGLPDEMILAITETKDGYLWIGTRGGLARFDGFQFVVFDRSNTPALRDDRVLSLYAAHNGDLWIGTAGGGVIRYHDGVFRSFGEQQGLTNGFVRAIYQTRRGRRRGDTEDKRRQNWCHHLNSTNHGRMDTPRATSSKVAIGFLWPFTAVLFYPTLGFLVPWGTIRTLAWVAACFSGPPTTPSSPRS